MIQFNDADLIVGGDVKVTNPRRDQHNQIGQILGIHADTQPTVIEVDFDGETHLFEWEDLVLI